MHAKLESRVTLQYVHRPYIHMPTRLVTFARSAWALPRAKSIVRYIYGKPAPALGLGGLALLANNTQNSLRQHLTNTSSTTCENWYSGKA